MEFTGERYVPELVSAKISYEHWHRYLFAKQFCTGKKVLDIACGEGYGSAYLAKFASHTTGVDISAEAIDHARNKYGGTHIEFVLSDAVQLPFDNEYFDTIVSFETLEHLSSEDQQLYITELLRILKKDGILIISTPNKKVYSDEASYANPYHLAELYKADFKAYLSAHFKNVVIFNQQIIGGSQISQRNDEQVQEISYLHTDMGMFCPGPSGQEAADTEYLVAVCFQSGAPSIAGNVLLDENNTLIKEYLALNKQ